MDDGFAQADLVVESEHHIPMAHQGYIEPHACIATINESGQATVWTCTQGHFELRAMTSKILGRPISNLKFIPSEIGGGFGGKTLVYLEPVAVLLSEKAGRPVKMMMTREEVFPRDGPHLRHVGANQGRREKNDGTLTAAKTWMAYEAGAFPGGPIGPGAMAIYAPYELENFHVEAFRRAGEQAQGRCLPGARRTTVDARNGDCDR